jgi:arylsulfatase A-like enzyme
MSTSRPNVLVVLADQLRASSVGYAGEEPVLTPHMDRLAAESAQCTVGVSLMPVCTPYRGALLTGRTPLSLGLVLNDIPLSTQEVSLGHAFGAAGYRTGYIGKWHLNGPDRPAWVPPGPARQGFEFWAAANFEHNYDRSVYFEGDSPEPRVWPGYDAQSQTTLAIDYMRARAAAQEPFLLVLSWGPPHHPYRTVSRSYLDLYDPAAIPARPNCPEPPREDLWGYYAQTSFLDDQLARLVQSLDELGLAEDTIVVFTSDHGDMHGSHGVYKKQWPWDEAIKVPFLVRYPRRVPGGTRHDYPVSNIDVMPTLLGLAGLPVPAPVEGVDLSRHLMGTASEEAPDAVLLMNPCPFSIGDPRGPDQVPLFQGMRMEYRGVRTRRYTYARTIDRPWLLYDNREDPFQLHNRIDDPACGALIETLEAQMQALMARIGDRFEPKEAYYERFGIELDRRGKVRGIVENPYPRMG